MIVPIRHVGEAGLTEEELEEYKKIKNSYINENYEYVIEATHKMKTVPAHFHEHLIIVRKEV